MLLAHKSELRRLLVRLQYFPFRIGLPAKSSLFANCFRLAHSSQPPPPGSWLRLCTHSKAAFWREKSCLKRCAQKHRHHLIDRRFFTTHFLWTRRISTQNARYIGRRERERERVTAATAAAVRAQSVLFANCCAAAAVPLRRPYYAPLCAAMCSQKGLIEVPALIILIIPVCYCWFYCDITFQGRQTSRCNYSHAPACRCCWKFFRRRQHTYSASKFHCCKAGSCSQVVAP